MKQIKTFVQKNQIIVLAGVIMIAFSTWMYAAYNNIQERDAKREARIEYLSNNVRANESRDESSLSIYAECSQTKTIVNGGTHYPSASIMVNKSYVAAE